MNLTFNTDADFDQIKTIVIDIIKNTANDFDLFLSTNSINNLSIHLSIAIIRIKSNNYIPLSNGQIASYKQEYMISKVSSLHVFYWFTIQIQV